MKYDVTILGAGPAGMIAMLRFAAAGFSVLGIEKLPRANHHEPDLRSTAFLMPAIDTLKQAHIWDALDVDAVALDIMEIVDAAQTPLKSVKFDAFDIGAAHFGFNIMNSKLRATLQNAANKNTNITMIYEDELTGFRQFSDHVDLKLSNSDPVQTRLLISAEGRNSSLRDKLGIQATRHEYGQWAQAFTVSHDLPHANISTEIHDAGGPFTTVPSVDINGRPASAIVWMDSAENAKNLSTLSHKEFERAINARSHNLRGNMKLETEIGRFPMILMRANKLHDHRCVLIGESAHVVPPIGAQGLNMSLKDIETLVRVCETGALQNPAQLETWARKRKADIAIRMRGIGALNSISIAGFDRAKAMRNIGLWALEKDSILKRGLMRLGLG